MKPRIAIIGAGMAGLSAAHALSHKAEIVIFDKGRGIGGRMATRYADDVEFDHGAQYFSIKTEAFRTFLEPAITAGCVELWTPAIGHYVDGKLSATVEKIEAFVGAPRMNDLPKFLAQNFNVHLRTEIQSITKNANGWAIKDASGAEFSPFDWVIVTAPSPQTQTLMPDVFSHKNTISAVQMHGNFTLMLSLESEPDLPWDGAFLEGSPIGWIALNNTKPGRKVPPALVIQSTNEWGETNLDEDLTSVEKTILTEASNLTGLDLTSLTYQSLHRWRYASVPHSAGQASLIDEKNQLAACGDWCIKGRVEAAFESGRKTAERILEHIAS